MQLLNSTFCHPNFNHNRQKRHKKGQKSNMFRQISIPSGAEQWLINLIEIYNRVGKSFKQIAEEQLLAEKSVSNVFLLKSKNPGVDLIRRILASLGAQWREIFGETGAVIGGQDMATLQNQVDTLTEENTTLKAEKDLAVAELEILRNKSALQESEIGLLKERLQHKEELLAIHNYYIKLKSNN